MDTILEKKKGIKKKHIPYIIVGSILLIAVLWLIFGNHAQKMNVEAQRMTISEVTRGMFPDYTRISGQVLPINTIHLSAIESGMVEEKMVEEGSTVTKGQVIVKLTSYSLNREILASEADLAEKENIHRNTMITMEQQKLDLQRDKLQLDTDVEQTKRTYQQYQRLYEENLVSKEEFLKAKENYELAVSKRTLTMERQEKDSVLRTNQIEQMEESLLNMKENFRLIRQRSENLNVRAPVDGQLGLLDVEIGQWIGAGSRIGLISVLSDFKIEANIDEHYIDKVRPGLSATFERQDRDFELRVRKVYPEVRDKQFKTEFVFEGERPDNIRAGQTYYISLQLGLPTEEIMIPRGTFYQTTGGKWIFVVTPDGTKAVRRNITIGRQNPTHYEVKEGLEPGERVITSGYDNYGDAQELILK